MPTRKGLIDELLSMIRKFFVSVEFNEDGGERPHPQPLIEHKD